MRSLLLLALGLTLSASPSPRLLESRAKPGGLLVVEVEGREPEHKALRVKFGTREHRFFQHPSAPERKMAALIPIPFDATPGPAELRIQGEGRDARLPFTIGRGPKGILNLKVAPGIAQPSAEDQARIRREREEILALYAASPGTRLWTTAFREPISSAVTCGFGLTRRFNGVTQSVHKGVDLRAATGTPVHASAQGTVVLAKELFFGGNLVLIDHGCGLFSAYAHLSRCEVQPGQSILPGQRVGLSGATGRVSAPHLHWGSSLDGVEVDPWELKRWTGVLSPVKSSRPMHRAPRRRNR